MSRHLYRLLSLGGSLRAARRSPGAYARRQVRRRADRAFNRSLRRILKP